MKPTPADILTVIAKAQAGDWLDPLDAPVNWYCELYGPDGSEAGNGNGHTAAEAMALAWLCAWAPDALIASYVELGSVPFEVPDDWKFALTPPWRSRRG